MRFRFTIFLLLATLQCSAQGYDISHLLPCNKLYARMQVREVLSADKARDVETLDVYDRQGRLIRTDEAEGTLISRYIYTREGNKEICRVHRYDNAEPEEIMLMVYDEQQRIVALYKAEKGTKLNYISKEQITYTGKQQRIQHSTYHVAAGLETLIKSAETWPYKATYEQTYIVDRTNDHSFKTQQEKGKTTFADSIWYANGRELRRLQYTNQLVAMSSTATATFETVHTYTGDTVRTKYSVSKRDNKTHEEEVITTNTLGILNDKGLEVELYDMDDKGNRRLNTTTSYQYY